MSSPAALLGLFYPRVERASTISARSRWRQFGRCHFERQICPSG